MTKPLLITPESKQKPRKKSISFGGLQAEQLDLYVSLLSIQSTSRIDLSFVINQILDMFFNQTDTAFMEKWKEYKTKRDSSTATYTVKDFCAELSEDAEKKKPDSKPSTKKDSPKPQQKPSSTSSSFVEEPDNF